MLPVESFVKTNFVDGIRFNPEQIHLTDEYYAQKVGLSNAFGLGRGVLVGFKGSMEVKIENKKLVVKPGALVDNEGNVIFIPKEHIILDNISNKQFENKKSLYIYIRHITKFDDLQESRHDKEKKLYYKIVEDYEIFIQDKNFRDKTLIELARFYVDYSVGANLKNSTNPYNPVANEIDIRFTPKIVGKNYIMNYDEKTLISSIIRRYANFLNELAFRKKLLSASQAASFGYKIATDVSINDITPWQLYDILYELLNISLQIYKEKPEIVNTGYWKNIKRLQSIFNFDQSYEAHYYFTYLDIDNSFFSKVIMHYSNAAIFDGNWDALFGDEKKEQTETQKEYLVVGSDPSCDVVLEGDDIASEHARLYEYKNGYFIEEIGETSGIYINAERLEKGVKKFVKPQDYIVLGKNGKLLNLNSI